MWQRRFNVSTSRLMDLRRGEAITREDTHRRKILKMENEGRGRKDAGSLPRTNPSPAIHICRVESLSNTQKPSVLFRTTKYSQREITEKLKPPIQSECAQLSLKLLVETIPIENQCNCRNKKLRYCDRKMIAQATKTNLLFYNCRAHLRISN